MKLGKHFSLILIDNNYSVVYVHTFEKRRFY